MSTEDQSRKTKKGRTEKRRRKESGSLLVWVLRTGRSSMVEPARAYNYPATIAQSFFAPHKPHHHNKVASRRWGCHSSSPNRRNHCSRRFRDSRSLGDSNSLHTLLPLTSGSPSSLCRPRVVRGGRRSST